MRLPKGAHESHPWRIREIAPDFRLEDAWALPAQGGADGFATLIEVMGSLDPTATPSRISRALFEIRFRLGRLLGWDVPAPQLPIPDRKETTLKDRLPRDLRNTTAGLKLGSAASDKLGVNFAPLYVTDLESAAEISNRTMHGVVHLSWVNQGRGRYQGQMAVYAKPRGLFGEAYMALIRPFRYLIVYSALMRQLGATVLEADGSRYHVHLVVLLGQGRVTFATFAKSRSAFWRYVLKAIMVAHRRVAPRLMERAIALKPTTDD